MGNGGTCRLPPSASLPLTCQCVAVWLLRQRRHLCSNFWDRTGVRLRERFRRAAVPFITGRGRGTVRVCRRSGGDSGIWGGACGHHLLCTPLAYVKAHSRDEPTYQERRIC